MSISDCGYQNVEHEIINKMRPVFVCTVSIGALCFFLIKIKIDCIFKYGDISNLNAAENQIVDVWRRHHLSSAHMK